MIPNDLVLQTSKVLLRPVNENDLRAFMVLCQDKHMWEYFSTNLADAHQLEDWMKKTLDERSSHTRIPFTIIDKFTGRIAGSSSIGNISFHDLRFEIGWSWLGKDFRSTGINRHAKFAMMKYGFEVLNFERIEFKTDVLNERARNGLRKIGAAEEGILRSHMTMWNNRRRTSIYYSVLKHEWRNIKQNIFSDLYEVD